ncbi:hypothetical protein EJ076_06990 [Mesorhizobium sp. M7D.F.Ca.US.005.01.1.1]|uniref:hypothetical protein n=1 Tax=Mesorhizobium sp. M7D.F.Ca.US.005.01.1.1 TaxID=2493678 RepID=UPI000F756E1F|nr:hypothetical protein [Mesorhizobium sp. M7D.F.Ca.US.005.01.1.1]AZO40893.1 hypothetical protein EJ076_06990 [Mesorhizobium sp. M7D.F.Ca.US.005.01.1.1]
MIWIEFSEAQRDILRVTQALAFGLLLPSVWIGQARLALDKAVSQQGAERFSGAQGKSRRAAPEAGGFQITI